MNLDELGEEWRATNEVAATKDQRDQLIATTCRRVERFWGRIFRRDMIETIAAVFVIIIFGPIMTRPDRVIASIGAGILVFWALFIIWKLHRARTVQQPAPLDAPVREFCRIELDRLDRQIQLLRSVLWWYIAPCIIGVNIVFIGMGGSRNESLVYGISTLLLAWGLYALNMSAIAKQLVPPRNELANLLSQLENPGSDSVRPVEQPKEQSLTLRRRSFVVVLVVTLAALGTAAAVFIAPEAKYPRRAPFTGVRWERNEPVVKIGKEWFQLVSLDGIAAGDIVAFSQRTYWLRWQKRFEEDLVEVLTRMGHEPGDSVRLVVRPLGSSTTRTLEDVPMTEANRRTIYKAARARESR
jgi:hypothetical protein